VLIDDFNRDGHLDVAVTNLLDFSVSSLLGSGDGTLQTHQEYAVGQYPEQVTAGDFNGDSFPDLVTPNSGAAFGHTVSVLLNKGIAGNPPKQ
jgi:hypothetical protein